MPGNKASLKIISPIIHPIGQVSTPRQYSSKPNNTSGALYHKVSISWVKGLSGIVKNQANPKSANFT